MVAAGEICYLVQQEALVDELTPEAPAVAISRWVQDTFPAERLGSTTVYRLAPK
jgi:hypothetical protein